MSPSALFNRLGAPLTNVMWSWGARRNDGVIFLRAWGDEIQPRDGRKFFRLVNRKAYETAPTNLGYNKRLGHLEELRNGAQGYVVLCTAVDTRAEQREIASFDARQLFKLGKIEIFEGDEWAEIVDRVDVRAIAPLR